MKIQEKFKQEKMVGWFDINQLAGTGIRAVLSSVFGSYSDKRETIASISEFEVYKRYSEKSELWFDYLSDTGDGFDSTYTMAHVVSRDSLKLVFGDEEYTTPRGDLIILGGDQVYPTATREEYQNRFLGPFGAATPWSEEGRKADMFAVPGNHDWYDGLTNFTKIFFQKRWIGSWQTQQNRSYFAIELRKNLWIWAIDIQLEADIDFPQLKYFDEVVTKHMQKGDKVILCSAEPSWIYHTSKKEEKIYQNLEFFQQKYIVDRGMEQILTLAGDLHHYARYSHELDSGKMHHKITAGGGGAFLHPTHNLPKKLGNMIEGNYDLKKTFPSRTQSRKLALGDLLFPLFNISFGRFLAIIYVVFAWLMYMVSYNDSEPGTIFDNFAHYGLGQIWDVKARFFFFLANCPEGIFLLLLFPIGFWKFCDVNSSKLKYIGLLGVLHGIAHVTLMLCSIWLFTYFNFNVLHVDEEHHIILDAVLTTAELFFVGGFMACVLTGLYLLLSNLVFGIHDNEAFSAMKIEGYKNFLRFHIKDDKLTIYPVGVKKVSKWKSNGEGFSTDDILHARLIEDPIVISLK